MVNTEEGIDWYADGVEQGREAAERADADIIARGMREPGGFYWVITAPGMSPAIGRLNHDRVFCFTDCSRKADADCHWVSAAPISPPADLPREGLTGG